ncbi:CRAL/TRIO domain-containing protein [Dichomitus squalens LYAD-421 SS1]|uniref:CRAL/TRIO domain-containing protein n=1 Tax=Dichomitus squalens (strain LYAD-421) TaxID=732165 RepID=R7SYL5_DICSQ|nr:CRAL/TRIO domain-containing protein [Dichomitus squalens LYAD-421 SS1]EJF61053.1 CRAL/TRIO domain-containing protein [Dichomitus squalens LYAD-421 SS1]
MSSFFSFSSSADQPAKGETITPDVTSGHLTHLTDDQQAAFATFKTVLAKAQLYTPPSDPHRPRPSHDDPTLLRFLRARRFDPQKAMKQFADSEAWRAKNNVETLYATFPVDEFETARRYYPRWTGRRDKNGLPLYVYRIGSLTSSLQKELNAVPPERRYQRIIALYETMTGFVLPLCSHLPRRIEPTPVTSVTTIIDFTDVSLPLLWSLRSHLQEASTLATANYPETLSTIVVVNTPSFFPTVWGWVKPWFDEGTRRKVHILGKDAGPALCTLIDPKDLPKTYGGELDWKFEDQPSLDDATKELIGEMPKGPVVFEDGKVVRPSPPSEPPTANGDVPPS